jgi:hypothetical protein
MQHHPAPVVALLSGLLAAAVVCAATASAHAGGGPNGDGPPFTGDDQSWGEVGIVGNTATVAVTIAEDGTPMAQIGRAPARRSPVVPQPVTSCVAMINALPSAPWSCYCTTTFPDSDWIAVFWSPDSACEPAAPAPTPAGPALLPTIRAAADSLTLPVNTPIVAPDPDRNEWGALAVGFPIWLTAGKADTLSTSVMQNGIAITIAASRESTTFHMGESDVRDADVTCTHMATRPTDLNPPAQKSPDCGYVYKHKGINTIIATTTWRINWTADGHSGSVTTQRDASAAEPLVIGSLISVNVEVPQPYHS